ncbi:PREDICTED: uncharacterized protein LOC105109148 [Populus euphratica]|uniref:Uncharacterized protein LOC105109148 n=1 Tax=Populus euphratica TaxID=75702 RepID=A0AAJ6X1L9_POPEU|nr:PREDICTED: uncharacterized protein LOC105109148 [Populus euphratica]
MGVGRTCLPLQLDLLSTAHSIFFYWGGFRRKRNIKAKHIDIRKTKLVPKHDATRSSTGAKSTADSCGRRSRFQKRTRTKASFLAKAPLSFSYFPFLHVRLLLNIAVFILGHLLLLLQHFFPSVLRIWPCLLF